MRIGLKHTFADMKIGELYKIYTEYPSVQTDTRKLRKGDLFFALKGPNFNGNEFAKKALDAGAAYAIIDEKPAFTDNRLIQTEDVLKTLQDLAKHHRLHLDKSKAHAKIPFIAITGSNGKTTTKELLNKVLASKYKTYTTEGNLNNHIGVPLTLLKIRSDIEIAVIEMGANHVGEIAGYCDYAMPTHGIITNCGKAHLEGFGSVENVRKGKGELFNYLRDTGGTAFVNNDDASVVALASDVKQRVFYGKNGKDRKAAITASDPTLVLNVAGMQENISTNLVGDYNFSNVLAAVCVGQYFDVEFPKIKEAIEDYHPSNSRSQLIRRDGNVIVSDTYNANPGSMKAAIENFSAMKGDKKILMLGSMMELGNESDAEHATIISLIDKYPWNAVVLVGEGFNALNHKYIKIENSSEARNWFHKLGPENAQVLLKGSRSMQMEKVLE